MTDESAAETFARIFRGRTTKHAVEIQPTAAELARANREAFTAYHLRHTPYQFAQAVTDHPQVQDWAARYLRDMIGAPSLLFAGNPGTGKTHAAYGALRYLAASGWPTINWKAIETVELFARLRPGGSPDPEAEFAAYANAPLLLLDDLCASRATNFVEDTTYRLINHRYNHGLPLIATTNIRPKNLGESLGTRTSSRLKEMCQVIDFGTEDRRRAPEAA